MFYCHFFFPPDKDEKTSSDPDCRWWPIWHEYRKEGRLIVYGSQVRITPNRIPNPDKYIAWADVIDLGNKNVRILGPFDFLNPSSCVKGNGSPFRQYVCGKIWKDLFDLCNERGIVPPRMVTPKKSMSKKRKSEESGREERK